MTIKVVDFICEACGSSYSLRYIEEDTNDLTPDFCPFCSEEITASDEEWDDIALFDYIAPEEKDEVDDWE
jgi:hypothetical protein